MTSLNDMADRLLDLAIELKRAVALAAAPDQAPSENLILPALEMLAAERPLHRIAPYAPLGGTISIGFQVNAGVEIELRRAAPPGGAPGLEMSLLDPGSSPWVSIELAWPWERVRAKDGAHVVLAGSAFPSVAIEPRLRLPVAGGGFIDVTGTSLRLETEQHMQVGSMLVEHPAAHEFDETRTPRIILFLERKPATIRLTRLLAW
jgi:hypothetical protein